MTFGELKLQRLDHPPASDSYANFPATFGRHFVIFGDAEEEFDWNGPFRREATATTAINALPEANRHFTDRGAIPTYLVDYPVVDNPDSAAIIRHMVENGACDIGTQLHPWVTPPYNEDVTPYNSYTGNLPRELQRAKLCALTDKITASIGVRPTCYRAGRYGIGEHTAHLLVEAGYKMDVSVRALFDYSANGGPDFTHHPVTPYWVGNDLLEIPLSAAWTGPLRYRSSLYRYPKLRGALARTHMLNRIALTPEDMPLPYALEAIRMMIRDDVQLFSLSFHTPSIVPGHTPYVRDAKDLKIFWAWWDGVLNLFDHENIRPIRSGEIYTKLRTART